MPRLEPTRTDHDERSNDNHRSVVAQGPDHGEAPARRQLVTGRNGAALSAGRPRIASHASTASDVATIVAHVQPLPRSAALAWPTSRRTEGIPADDP
jgi:hypothetical protein